MHSLMIKYPFLFYYSPAFRRPVLLFTSLFFLIFFCVFLKGKFLIVKISRNNYDVYVLHWNMCKSFFWQQRSLIIWGINNIYFPQQLYSLDLNLCLHLFTST